MSVKVHTDGQIKDISNLQLWQKILNMPFVFIKKEDNSTVFKSI